MADLRYAGLQSQTSGTAACNPDATQEAGQPVNRQGAGPSCDRRRKAFAGPNSYKFGAWWSLGPTNLCQLQVCKPLLLGSGTRRHRMKRLSILGVTTGVSARRRTGVNRIRELQLAASPAEECCAWSPGHRPSHVGRSA